MPHAASETVSFNEDVRFMRHALRLATRHLGATGENPAAGCVLVRDGQVVGTGVTALTGRPHAETQALASAGAKAQGATAYITLEPCSHHGQTPPCADALIKAGIARVVIALLDLNPQVAGEGRALLEKAGIAVSLGVCEEEAQIQHQGFFRRIEHGLPRVTVKLARSADGFMGYKDPEKRIITGELARRHGQALRSRAGAIITGIGTVLADDPSLNVRIEGLENRSPMRMVVDRKLQMPLHMKLVQTAKQWPTYLLTSKRALDTQIDHAKSLEANGVHLVVLEEDTASIAPILRAAASLGVNHALIEAGPTFSAVALASGLVDVVYDYTSSTALHEQGDHPFRPNLEEIAHLLYQIPLSADMLRVYKIGA